ncbi:MAG: class I SAM-dependent methyltransferase [Vicinamibacterales bacterium]
MSMLHAVLARLRRHSPRRVDAQDGYARWAPLYAATPHNAVMSAEASAVESVVRRLTPTRALDAGTGTGRNLRLLRGVGAHMVVGLDLSAPMLQRVATEHARRVRGDAMRLPFQDGCFDLVTSSLMCGDVPELDEWIGEAARLRSGGHLVIRISIRPGLAKDGAGRSRRHQAGPSSCRCIHMRSTSIGGA